MLINLYVLRSHYNIQTLRKYFVNLYKTYENFYNFPRNSEIMKIKYI